MRAHAFRWGTRAHGYRRLKLAQLLGQRGVLLTWERPQVSMMRYAELGAGNVGSP